MSGPVKGRLSQTEIRLVAAKAGVGEKGILRLLGSQKIPLLEVGSGNLQTGPAKACDIGLRVNNAEIISAVAGDENGRELILDSFVRGMREYQHVCPLVVGWVGRGDFNPKRYPARLTPVHVRHASITAGRLRAKIIQMLSMA